MVAARQTVVDRDGKRRELVKEALKLLLLPHDRFLLVSITIRRALLERLVNKLSKELREAFSGRLGKLFGALSVSRVKLDIHGFASSPSIIP